MTTNTLLGRDAYLCYLTARAQRILAVQAVAASRGNTEAVAAAASTLERLEQAALDALYCSPTDDFDRTRHYVDAFCAPVEALVDPTAQARGEAAEERLRAKTVSSASADIDRVAAALIPAAGDEAMGITDAHNHWELALAEANRAEIALDEAREHLDDVRNIPSLAKHLVATKSYAEALLWYANAKTELHMATMTPKEAANLAKEIEDAEDFED